MAKIKTPQERLDMIIEALKQREKLSTKEEFSERWLQMSPSYLFRVPEPSEKAWSRLWWRLTDAGHYDLAHFAFEGLWDYLGRHVTTIETKETHAEH